MEILIIEAVLARQIEPGGIFLESQGMDLTLTNIFRHIRTVIMLSLCVVIYPLGAQPNQVEPKYLSTAIANSNQLHERAIKIFKSSSPQITELKNITEEYNALLLQWPQYQNIAIETPLASTGLIIGHIYQRTILDTTAALTIYSDGISRWGKHTESDIAQSAAYMYLHYGAISGRVQVAHALNLYDEAIARYSPDNDPRVQAAVIRLLGAKGQLLLKLNQLDEGFSIFDKTETTYANTVDVRLVTALIDNSIAKADQLIEMRKRDDAVASLKNTLRIWDSLKVSSVEELMTAIVVRLADDAATRGSPEVAIDLFKDLLHRSEKLNIHPAILKAHGAIVLMLYKMNKNPETIASSDQFIARFSNSTLPNADEWLAEVLIAKGASLAKLGKPQESMKTFDQLIDQFGNSKKTRVLNLVNTAKQLRQVAQGNLFRSLR